MHGYKFSIVYNTLNLIFGHQTGFHLNRPGPSGGRGTGHEGQRRKLESISNLPFSRRFSSFFLTNSSSSSYTLCTDCPFTVVRQIGHFYFDYGQSERTVGNIILIIIIIITYMQSVLRAG